MENAKSSAKENWQKGEEKHNTSQKRILCVDDDRNFLELMSEVLHLGGYEVQTATSAKYAKRILRESRFHLIIVDLCMPGTDGIQFIHELRKLKPGQRIIVVTGFPSQRTQWETLRLGAIDYIPKPFSPKRFLGKVKQALKKPSIHFIGFVELSCEELIQLYSFGLKNVTLKIRSNGNLGIIYIKNGQPIHSETGNLSGEDAFFEILSWKTGMFTIEAYKDVPRTIENCTDTLLIMAARRQDEFNICGEKCLAKSGY